VALVEELDRARDAAQALGQARQLDALAGEDSLHQREIALR